MQNIKIKRYDFVTRLLHWLIAILLIGLVILGLYMMSIEDQPNSGWYFNLHKSFGIIAGFLILFRVIWRLNHKPPSLNVPYWQIIVTRTVHWSLYVCMVLMPLTGFIGASFGRYGITFFGIKLPTWVNQNRAIAKQLFAIHGVVAWILVALVILHILAALKHLIVNKDQVFQRML